MLQDRLDALDCFVIYRKVSVLERAASKPDWGWIRGVGRGENPRVLGDGLHRELGPDQIQTGVVLGFEYLRLLEVPIHPKNWHIEAVEVMRRFFILPLKVFADPGDEIE